MLNHSYLSKIPKTLAITSYKISEGHTDIKAIALKTSLINSWIEMSCIEQHITTWSCDWKLTLILWRNVSLAILALILPKYGKETYIASKKCTLE